MLVASAINIYYLQLFYNITSLIFNFVQTLLTEMYKQFCISNTQYFNTSYLLLEVQGLLFSFAYPRQKGANLVLYKAVYRRQTLHRRTSGNHDRNGFGFPIKKKSSTLGNKPRISSHLAQIIMYNVICHMSWTATYMTGNFCAASILLLSL